MFDVKKHLIKVQNDRLYLPVASRLVWFRQEHPDWGIETKPVVIDTEKQYAIFEASVFNADGKLMAKGTKMETVRGFPDYIEKSETGAIGRALAVCGFGTQFAPDLDEVAGKKPVDSPQRGNGYTASGNGAHASETDKQTPDPKTAATDHDHSEHECAGCGRIVTKGQEALSVRKYGEALCPDCQKERRAAEAAV